MTSPTGAGPVLSAEALPKLDIQTLRDQLDKARRPFIDGSVSTSYVIAIGDLGVLLESHEALRADAARLAEENRRLTSENADLGDELDAAKQHVTELLALVEQRDLDERILRRGWWLSHGCQGLYGDDGEMQCGSCMIDFKRMSPCDIEARLMNNRLLSVRAPTAEET